jgi:hypothetical protein
MAAVRIRTLRYLSLEKVKSRKPWSHLIQGSRKGWCKNAMPLYCIQNQRLAASEFGEIYGVAPPNFFSSEVPAPSWLFLLLTYHLIISRTASAIWSDRILQNIVPGEYNPADILILDRISFCQLTRELFQVEWKELGFCYRYLFRLP